MLFVYSRSVTERHVLEAVAYVFRKRIQMLKALCELGYHDAREREPVLIQHYIDRLLGGEDTTIGTPEDPFLLIAANGQPIAHYWIEPRGNRCEVQLRGSDEFRAAYAQIALRDGGSTLH